MSNQFGSIEIEPCKNNCVSCKWRPAEVFNVMSKFLGGNLCVECWQELTHPELTSDGLFPKL